jgi:peptidoglycan/xylan/chitin deacetylase (PgdA/CDA1 family)
MKNISFLFLIGLLSLIGCNSKPAKTEKEAGNVSQIVENAAPKKTVTNNADAILSKKEVPVLCYHNIKNISAGDGEMTRLYTVTPTNFAQQMKALSDEGYHTILPHQLNDYLVHDAPLPANPIMITFDDTKEDQYTVAAPEMKKYGFKGVFFIMTVAINRPHYMTKEQIKDLSDKGHEIGAHTWDHHMVTKYAGDDWEAQLTKPKKKLEEIIGKPIKYFAYPFGLWNTAAIPEIKSRGYEQAYILATKRDSVDPLHTIRRIIVAGQWSAPSFMKAIKSSFNK